MTEIEAWLKLWHIPGIGPKTFNYLLSKFSSPNDIFSASYEKLIGSAVPDKVAKAIINDCTDNFREDMRWLNSNSSHHIVLLPHKHYPELLRQIYLPPPILYAIGNVSLLNTQPCIAMVGGRKASTQGRSVAYKLSSQLASTGISVVSGLARGIDREAHLGALNSDNGHTIAVLANGLDDIYPREHRSLALEIASEGLLLSEFPPHTKPLPQHFPRRNRIISGLSQGTVVIEAAVKSGSLITARYALEQGREVFAVPGPINNPLNHGCHNLIQQGAKLTTCVDDIFTELPISTGNPAHVCMNNEQPLTENAAKLLDCLEYTPMPVELIIEKSGLTPEAVSSMLTELETGGRVTSDAFGHYIRA
tara:strand:+ start:180221 stop:181309 length:1089 start_codon:yes stop_codon:yes gene_type:complete